MKTLFPILLLALLTGCGPAPTPIATATIPPTVTQTPTETPIPTATPIPTYSIEQLNEMTIGQKLAIAPQVKEAPEDVVASYLPSGVDASKITWGERTLSYWGRVVAYNGTTKDGKTVTMYFDLESGQWAKKYNNYEEVKQISEDKVPDIMVLTDSIMGDDRLIRSKLQLDEVFSQPQVMIDGMQVFRDEKGYPKAVWDTIREKWLTPEEANVVWTFDKFKAVSDVPFTTEFGEGNYNYLFNRNRRDFLTDPNQIENLPNGTFILILNPSGEMTAWTSQKEAANRAREGATIIVGRGETQTERNENFGFSDHAAWEISFDQYQKGDRSLFVTYGDVGVKSSQIQGQHSTGVGYDVEDLPQVTDSKTGKIICPVIRLPKHAEGLYGIGNPSQPLTDPVFWLDYLIKSGATKISISAME